MVCGILTIISILADTVLIVFRIYTKKLKGEICICFCK